MKTLRDIKDDLDGSIIGGGIMLLLIAALLVYRLAAFIYGWK